jgi:hypothetical protein
MSLSKGCTITGAQHSKTRVSGVTQGRAFCCAEHQ